MGFRLRVGMAGVLGWVLIAGCGAGADGTVAAPVTADGARRVEVSVTGGTVTGGVHRYTVPVGSRLELVVASDVADQVHLHGYDRLSYVTAGASTTLRLVTDVPGVFEVELEQRGTQLAQLEVR